MDNNQGAQTWSPDYSRDERWTPDYNIRPQFTNRRTIHQYIDDEYIGTVVPESNEDYGVHPQATEDAVEKK